MRGHFFRKPRTDPQVALSLDRPAQPNERLRNAFRDARLDRLGLDFGKVLLHQRAARLLSDLARAQQRGLVITARNYARQLINLKGELQ